MTKTERTRIAEAANTAARLSLQWADPNGTHIDALAKQQDYDPYTLDGAWQAIADMLTDS